MDRSKGKSVKDRTSWWMIVYEAANLAIQDGGRRDKTSIK